MFQAQPQCRRVLFLDRCCRPGPSCGSFLGSWLLALLSPLSSLLMIFGGRALSSTTNHHIPRRHQVEALFPPVPTCSHLFLLLLFPPFHLPPIFSVSHCIAPPRIWHESDPHLESLIWLSLLSFPPPPQLFSRQPAEVVSTHLTPTRFLNVTVTKSVSQSSCSSVERRSYVLRPPSNHTH